MFGSRVLCLQVLTKVLTWVMFAAVASAKTVYIPPSWQSTGEVPWANNRLRESNNFVLIWGEKSGTNPTSAPSPYNFDPADIITQLENVYDFYLNDMRFTTETNAVAQHKIVVIVTRTWNREALDAWATGGSAEGRVGVINIAPGAALPGSWGLAHELGHVLQNLVFLGRPGMGFTDASAGFFWEASAEFMAMQVYPNGGAGDLTRFLTTENLAYSSTRHHYGAWMLIQYLCDKNGGVEIFNRLWNEAQNTEHPLETYRRIAGLTQAQLNVQMGEYGQHQVTYDYTNRASFIPFVNDVFGKGFINAYPGILVEAVNQGAGHYAVPYAQAPSDYGYNIIELTPSSSGGLVKVHFKGHVNSNAGSGWSYGFVGVSSSGVPRYGPISTSADSQVQFQTQAGERVYLAVVGAPSTVHKYAFQDGFTKQWRYAYEFGISGAVPTGYQSNYQRPPAVDGRWHSNGGGWVDNRANVASTAFVGPRAAVFGSSTVTGNARIEGLSWINSGATIGGNAVIKDNALIQGGANLSGSLVAGGDAELANTCSSGTYMTFDQARGCDGRGPESDINPPITRFRDDQVAVS